MTGGHPKTLRPPHRPADPRIVELKSQVEAIRTYTVQKQLGKDAELSAAEIVRRAERGIGLAIRKGQEAGEMRRRGEGGGDPRFVDPDPGQNKMSPKAYLTGGSDASMTYAVTDDVTDETFEEALTEAKEEGNLSRANVVRKVEAKKPETAPPPPAPSNGSTPKKPERSEWHRRRGQGGQRGQPFLPFSPAPARVGGIGNVAPLAPPAPRSGVMQAVSRGCWRCLDCWRPAHRAGCPAWASAAARRWRGEGGPISTGLRHPRPLSTSLASCTGYRPSLLVGGEGKSLEPLAPGRPSSSPANFPPTISRDSLPSRRSGHQHRPQDAR